MGQIKNREEGSLQGKHQIDGGLLESKQEGSQSWMLIVPVWYCTTKLEAHERKKVNIRGVSKCNAFLW